MSILLMMSSPLIAQTSNDFFRALQYPGNPTVVRSYLEKNQINLNVASPQSICGTLLPLACAYSIEVMAVLVEKGADINLKTKDGTILDQVAGHKDDGKGARFLIGKGAKPSALTLFNAAWYENLNLVQELIDSGVDVNYRNAENGYTPLLLACEKGFPLKLVTSLLNAGARVDVQTNEKFTPLHFYPQTPQHGHQNVSRKRIPVAEQLEKVELLISKGAKLEARDQEGFTPLMQAASRNEDVAMLLISKGANIQAVSNKKGTLLQLAAHLGSVMLMNYFLDHGANLHAKNQEGYTAIFYAAMKGQYPGIQLLIDKGASCKDVAQDGMTPLHFISQLPTSEADFEYVEAQPEEFYKGLELILKNSNPSTMHALNKRGESPWYYLTGWGVLLPRKIQIFLDAGANRNAKFPKTGLTLLQTLEKTYAERGSGMQAGARADYEESIRMLKGN